MRRSALLAPISGALAAIATLLSSCRDRPESPAPVPSAETSSDASTPPAPPPDLPGTSDLGEAVGLAPLHPLPELVREGTPALASVYNAAARDIVLIDGQGHVTCEDKRRLDSTAGQRPLACRDPRLAFRWTGPVQHYFQDAVHQMSGPVGGAARVELLAGGRPVHSWSIAPGFEPRGCGREGLVSQQSQFTVDLTCAGDVAVVRWVIWRGFFNRECDPAPRSTRAIGPDLTCPMQRDDANARVVDSGILRVDLKAGVGSPIELTRTE